MTFRIVALLALPLVATACSPEAPAKRQPGSWSQKIEIVKFEGKGATPETKTQMQKMFDTMSTLSVCLTPAAAAKEDIGKAMEQMSARGQNCTFAKKEVTGATIAIDATCKQPNGGTVKMTMNGSTGAIVQDMTMKSEGFTANGTREGTMEMHVKSTRNGECKPTDVTPPEAPATGPAPVAPAKP